MQHNEITLVVIPIAITRPSPRRTEPAEDTTDSVLTQHSSLESQSSPSVIPDTQSQIGADLATPRCPPEVSPQLELNPFPTLPEDPELDTMSYHPYTRYTDGPDIDDHIHSFLNTWQANHSKERLTAMKVDTSKIAEFTHSLDGPTGRWYSRHDFGEFTTFQDVSTQFLELFHQEIPKRELLCQFYTIG